MNRTIPWRFSGARHMMGVALLLGYAAPTWAQLNIAVDVTPTGGGIFHYDYAVTNFMPPDVLLVTIEVPLGSTTISNLVAPAGFQASFDSGLGLLDFIADAQSFELGVQVSGFAFDSPFGPGQANYSTLNLDGMFFMGTTTAPVPEPATAMLVGLALAALFARRCRTSDRGLKLPRHRCPARLESLSVSL